MLPALAATAAPPRAAVAATCVAPSPARETVLLVHGWNATASQMDTMAQALRCAGYPAYSVPFPVVKPATGLPVRGVFRAVESEDNYVNAATIRSAVAVARAADPLHKKVALVGYSMGGLSARYFLHNLDGIDAVDKYVGLAVPEHGTDPPSATPGSAALEDGVCNYLGWAEGGQMCRDNYTSGPNETPRRNAFLEALNSGDETPGTVAYTTIRDGRGTSARLRGSCDVVAPWASHLVYPTDPAVFAIVLAAIRGASCGGTVIPDGAGGGGPAPFVEH